MFRVILPAAMSVSVAGDVEAHGAEEKPLEGGVVRELLGGFWWLSGNGRESFRSRSGARRLLTDPTPGEHRHQREAIAARAGKRGWLRSVAGGGGGVACQRGTWCGSGGRILGWASWGNCPWGVVGAPVQGGCDGYPPRRNRPGPGHHGAGPAKSRFVVCPGCPDEIGPRRGGGGRAKLPGKGGPPDRDVAAWICRPVTSAAQGGP